MSFVTYWSRVRMRSTWRSVLTLALLIGLAGGSIVALVAGGQRTDSAYLRFFAKSRGPDATVFANLESPQTLSGLRVMEHLPEVASYGALQGYTTTDGTMVGGPLGPGYQHTVSVPRLIAGRLPRGAREVAVDWTIAQAHHLHVGDLYRVGVVSDDSTPNGPPTTLHLALRVVGIAVNADAFPPYAQDQTASSLVDPSFVARYRHALGPPQLGLELRLRGGQRGVAAFERSDQRAFPGQPVVVGSSAPQTQAVQNSIHPAAVALWLLGAALAVMSLLIVFQLFRRLSAGEEDEYVAAAAQGATRRQLLAAELARALAIALGAAVVAAAAAVALSPFFPLGIAGVAEPDPGVWLDWPVLLAGVSTIVMLTVGLAAYPSWRATGRAMAPMSAREQTAAYRGTASWTPRWLWLRPMSWVGAVHGLRTGRGASAVPVRASITAMLLAVTGLTTALTFGASLEHLVTTPALYGWSWDAHIYDNGENGTPVLVPKLVKDRWLSDVIVSITGIPIRIDGRADLGAGLDPVKGSATVITTSGRTPARPNEIDLGPNTLRRLHAHLGGQVRVTISAIQGPTRTFTVVGTVIAPWADQSESFNGGGAVMTNAAFERLIPPHAFNIPPPSDAFVKFSTGAMTAAHLSQLRHQIGEEYSVLPAQPPTDLLNFGRVRDLPLILAFLLVGLAAVTLFLTLLSSAARRRSEMAVLKALGYRPAQLQGVVAWQSTAMTLVGLVIGLPLGIAMGRWLWIIVADHLALLGQPVVPVWQIALVAVGSLVVANVAGAWPGLVVARTPVTRVLRAA